MARAVGLGAFLRNRREAKGLSVADVASATRIAPRILDALEHDRPDGLPAPVFVRGFIRAYCAAVEEPADHALELYEARQMSVVGLAPPVAPAPRARRASALATAPPRSAVPIVRPLFLAAGLGVLLGGLVAYFVVLSRETPRPATPAIQIVPRPAETAPPRRSEPAAAPMHAGVTTGSRVLVGRAHDTTWVKTRPANAPPAQALLPPGPGREWLSCGRFTAGSAGGVVPEPDGVLLRPLGRAGEMVRDLATHGEPSA